MAVVIVRETLHSVVGVSRRVPWTLTCPMNGHDAHAVVLALRAHGAALWVDPADDHLVVVFAPNDSPPSELLEAVVDARWAVAAYLCAEEAVRDAERAALLPDD